MEDNLDKEDFDTNQMSRILGVSRTQLYRKLKALTGVSASTFIRSFRLAKAQNLIVTKDMNMSEIAYEVGFKDPAYFTRAFTKEFGIPPSLFRSSHAKK